MPFNNAIPLHCNGSTAADLQNIWGFFCLHAPVGFCQHLWLQHTPEKPLWGTDLIGMLSASCAVTFCMIFGHSRYCQPHPVPTESNKWGGRPAFYHFPQSCYLSLPIQALGSLSLPLCCRSRLFQVTLLMEMKKGKELIWFPWKCCLCAWPWLPGMEVASSFGL